MIIQVTDIYKSFGSVSVLNGISLTINEAEVVSIVGKSGAGKTTLLQIMGTLLNADSGEITMLQTKISGLKERQISNFRNKNIGFVFQNHQLLPEFTALENVCMPSLIQGNSISKAEKRAKELIDFLGVSHRLTHKPAELSGGEQQRVAVARALMNNPSIIFADEPSGNLDSKHKTELHELFFTLRNEFKQTFVIVTHDNALAQLSDRIIVMEDGKIAN